MMELDLLTAVSPIDGRYRSKAGTLAAYFSEYDTESDRRSAGIAVTVYE